MRIPIIFCTGGLALILANAVHAQNGRILDQQVFTITDSEAKKLPDLNPDTLDVIRQVEMREITYLSDGLKVKGFLLSPIKTGRYPVIIYNRGGCKDFGALTKAVVARWLSTFASWGYVVVASQYRGNAGSEGKDQFGGDDINDVLNLLPLIDSLPNVDASRIGMWGESRGGLMTYIALTKTDRISAAVSVSAPANLKTMAPYRKSLRPNDDFEEFCLRAVIPNYDQNKQKELEARSPIRWPGKMNKTTPILIFHGTADWRVPARDSLDLASELLRLRHPFRLVMLEGGDHGLSEYISGVDQITKEWLDWYVRDKKKWPSLEPHGP